MRFFSGKKEKENQALIEQIILENYNRYFRLAYSYVHNEADACDIVQNGAYKALKNSGALQKPEYAETWVYRIMLNECFRYFNHPKFLSYEEMQEESGMEAGSVEDNYVNVDLQRALDTLQEKDRAIIILKYFEDKKLDEIAYILDENINTIKSRLYRSIRKLRSALTDEAGRQGCSFSREIRR